MIGHKKSTSRVIKRQRLSVEANRTIFALVVTLSLLILSLLAGQFYLNSSSAQKVYRVTQLKELNNELKNNQEDFNSKLTEALSFTNIQSTDQVLDMNEPESKQFINGKKS